MFHLGQCITDMADQLADGRFIWMPNVRSMNSIIKLRGTSRFICVENGQYYINENLGRTSVSSGAIVQFVAKCRGCVSLKSSRPTESFRLRTAQPRFPLVARLKSAPIFGQGRQLRFGCLHACLEYLLVSLLQFLLLVVHTSQCSRDTPMHRR